MQKFGDDLASISFVMFPASTIADIYDQYVHDLGYLIDRHAPLICVKIIKNQLTGCQIHITGPNQLGTSLSVCGLKTGLS